MSKPLLAAGLTYLMALNLFDLFATKILLHAGAHELNPLMRFALAHGPFAVALLKIAMPAGLLWWVWKKQVEVKTLVFPVVIYTALVAYQATWMLRLFA